MKTFILIIAVVVAFAECTPTPILKDFSDGYIQFSANVYKELVKSHSGNFLVCPLSVENVLALAHVGAKGPTAKQITSALHLPESTQATQKIFQELTPRLQGSKDYELSNANKIYVKKDFEINKDFKEAAVNAFQSEIENIDFEAAEKAASTMNQWVEEKTQNKIKNLISKDDLDEDTRAVLINALYFRGKWRKQFDEKLTTKKSFHINYEKKTDVNMMQITDRFRYYQSPELKAKILEIPYKGNDITMTFVLPNEIEGLSNLEENIADVLQEPKYIKPRVHVQIPKFKVESQIDFNGILQELGIKDAFEDFADFSGIGAASEPLKISKVIQKTFIELEEKGTTAAAATAGVVKYVRTGHVNIPLVEFNANHPFIYYLKSPAGILFVGRYVQG